MRINLRIRSERDPLAAVCRARGSIRDESNRLPVISVSGDRHAREKEAKEKAGKTHRVIIASRVIVRQERESTHRAAVSRPFSRS